MSLKNKEATKLQVQHVRFTSEFLRRLNLLQSDGGLVDIAGLPLHLYHDKHARNSASFLFTYLFRMGAFNDLAALSKEKRVKVSPGVRLCVLI